MDGPKGTGLDVHLRRLVEPRTEEGAAVVIRFCIVGIRRYQLGSLIQSEQHRSAYLIGYRRVLSRDLKEDAKDSSWSPLVFAVVLGIRCRFQCDRVCPMLTREFRRVVPGRVVLIWEEDIRGRTSTSVSSGASGEFAEVVHIRIRSSRMA